MTTRTEYVIDDARNLPELLGGEQATAAVVLDTASVVRNGYWHRLRRVEARNDPDQKVIA